MNIAIVGGGASGFFLAIHLKELLPAARIVIVERSRRVLAKVKVSGGGRCNVTNSFASVDALTEVYPRGARLLDRLFRKFSPADAYRWFERHGVPLVTQDDDCVFPRSQRSESIIDCLTRRAAALGVEVCTETTVRRIVTNGTTWRIGVEGAGEHLNDETFSALALTTGGDARGEWLETLCTLGHRIEPPCPSLFAFAIDHAPLRALSGIVVEEAKIAIAGTRFRANGALLITHRGLSGPAVLRLSAHAARELAERGYRAPLLVSWIGTARTDEAAAMLAKLQTENAGKLVGNARPEGLQNRLWHYLARRADIDTDVRWAEVGRKSINRLANALTADAYTLAGRDAYKEEFVTCGGVALSSVGANTLESRACPGLFFAGELLDIDGVTGGFNFTAAWTTGYVAAEGIAARLTVAD